MADAMRAPDSEGVFIPGRRGRLFSTIYYPAGEGPYPVIVVCHGMPGNERLLDFVVFLREQGFATVSFHYSGAWGSDGDYSVNHCLQDTDAVFEYVQKNACGLFDTARVYVLGHSLGGLCASYALGTRREIRAGMIIMPYNQAAAVALAERDEAGAAAMTDLHDGQFAPWLKGFSWAGAVADFRAEPARYTLSTYAEGIAEKPVLFIAGERDNILARREHLDTLANAVHAYGKGLDSLLSFDTDHGIGSCRMEIRNAAAEFFRKQLKA